MLCSPRDGIGIPYALSRRCPHQIMEVKARDDSAATNAHQKILECTEASDDNTATRNNGRTMLGGDEEGSEANTSQIHVLPLSPHPISNDDSPELIKPNHRALFTRLGGGRKYINMMFGSRDVVTKDKIKTIKAEMDKIIEAKPVEEHASDNVQLMKESVDGHTQTNLQPKTTETSKTQKEEFIIGHPDNLLDSITSEISEILSPHTNVTIVTQKSGEKSTIEERSTNIIQDGLSIAPKIEIPTVLCVLEDVYKGTADLLLDVYDDVFPFLPLNANGEISFCTCIGVGRGGSEERPQYDCLEKSSSLEHTAQHGLLTGIQVVNDCEHNPSGTEIGRDTRNQYNSMRRDSELCDSVDSVACSYPYRPEPAYQFQMNSHQHELGEPYRQYPGVPSQSSSGLIPSSISSLTAQLGKIYPLPNPVHNENIFSTQDIATFTNKCQRGTTSSAASIMISDSSSEDNIDERQDRYAIVEEEEADRDLTLSVSPTRITMVNPFADRYHVSDNTTMACQDHQGMYAVIGADSTSYTTWNNHIMTTQEQYLPVPRVLTSDNSTYNNLHHMQQNQVHQISHEHQQSESKKLASFAC